MLLGFVLIFSPSTLDRERPLRHGADLVAVLPRDPGRDDRLHRNRDRLEPRGGDPRPRARASRARSALVAVAVFAIYFTLPLIALSALPVHLIDGKQTTLLALPPEKHGFQNDPVLGVVEHLGI